jgi:hypothetical protein
MKLPFGNWMPDLPAEGNPGALLAKNCHPLAVSYGEFRSLTELSSALDLQCRGSYWAAYNGVNYNFAADMESLYLYDGAGGWDNISNGVYSASFWDFTHFQNRILAADGGAGPIQYFDMGASSDFDDLPGSPPLARVMAVVRDFLVLGNYEIGSEIEPGGLAWSGFNNTEIWTPSLATQCGRRRSRGDGGDVVRIVGGSQGIVWREEAILTMRYAGPPTIWQFDDVTTKHGTPAGRSVCWTRDQAFYYSQEGFMQIDRRTMQITAIGEDQVDDWFLAECAPAEIQNLFGGIDRKRGFVYWAFRSSSSSVPFNRVLVFNYLKNRWAYAEIEVEWLGEFISSGYNLDTIGAVLGGNIDSASISVDNPLYSSSALGFIAFDPSHRAANFAGDPLVAEIDTTEAGPSEMKRGFVNGVVPIVEGGPDTAISVAPLTRNSLTENPQLGSFVARTADTGQCDMRVNARYMRYRVRVAGGFQHAKRINVNFKERGRR